MKEVKLKIKLVSLLTTALFYKIYQDLSMSTDTVFKSSGNSQLIFLFSKTK